MNDLDAKIFNLNGPWMLKSSIWMFLDPKTSKSKILTFRAKNASVYVVIFKINRKGAPLAALGSHKKRMPLAAMAPKAATEKKSALGSSGA